MTTSADPNLAPNSERGSLIHSLIRAASVAGLTAGAWLALSLSSTANAQSPVDDLNHVAHGVSESANQLVGGATDTASAAVNQVTGPVATAAVPVVDEVADYAVPVVDDFVAPMLDDVSDYTEPVVDDVVAPVLEDVSDYTEPVAGQAAAVVEPVLGDVAETTEPAVEAVAGVAEPVVEIAAPVVDAVAPVVQVIDPIVAQVGEVTSPILSPVLVPITNPFRPASPLPLVTAPGSQAPAFSTPTSFALPVLFSADFVEPGAVAASGNRSGGGIPAAGALSAQWRTGSGFSNANQENFFTRTGSAHRHDRLTASPVSPAAPLPIAPAVPAPAGTPGCPVGTGNGATGSSSLQLISTGPADHNAIPATAAGNAGDHDTDLLSRSDEPGTSPA